MAHLWGYEGKVHKISRKHNLRKGITGSVTVLLIIILIPCLLLSGIVVDTSRVNIVKAEVSSAGELAMNAALARYDTIVKDVYGLFAMSQNESPEELQARIRDYFEQSLVSYGVTDADSAGDYLNALLGDFNNLMGGTPSGDFKTLLGLEVLETSFTIVRPENSSLANPGIMRKQIVEYMKFRGPVNFGLSIFDAVKSFSTIEEQSKVVEKQVTAQESLQDVTKDCKKAIEAIREYDADFKEINQGEKAVRGLHAHSDGLIVPIVDYKKQVLKYRNDSYGIEDDAQWDASYERINRLIMCFLLKSPDIKNLCLYDQRTLAETEYFVNDNGINTKKSDISVEVTLNKDLEGARSQFETQESALKSGSSKAQTYITKGYVTATDINTADNTIKRDTEAEAIGRFIEFEKFVTDNADAEVKYSDIKAVFEDLHKLHKYHENLQKYLKEVEKSAADEMKSAKSEYDKAESELNELLKAKEEAEKAAKDAKSKKGNQTPLPSAPSAEEIAAKTKERDEKKAAYEEKEKAHKAAEDEMKSYTDRYKSVCAVYNPLCKAYISDLNDYELYKTAARNTAQNEITWIHDQFKTIKDRTKYLQDSLDDSMSRLKKIQSSVEKYDSNVTAWADANKAYSDANGKDTFSAANTGEIESAHKNISKDQIDKVVDDVNKVAEEYKALYNALNDSKSEDFKYDSTKIYDITSVSKAESIAAGKKDKLPEFVTKEDADKLFDSMYKVPQMPKAFEDEKVYLSFVDPGPIRNSFLAYLNSTYPSEEKSTAEQKEGKKQYKEMLKNLKSDNDGTSITDGQDYTGKIVDGGESATVTGNPLGYSYEDKKKLDSKNLPSTDFAMKSNDASAKALTIKESGDKVQVADSLKKNNEGASSVLSGIENVASTSLENIYIVDYIFENFSYNTMMQDIILEGEEIEKGADVEPIKAKATISDPSIVAKYTDKALTLSNIPINKYNNYIYGAEIEYILYGNLDVKKNVTSAKASIYAIRSLFNMIYAFTNSEIRNETRNIGLMVQAATMQVVPYQAVQVVLQLALAFAESAIDLTSICNGMSVVVVKSEDTWNLSLKRATQIAGTFIADTASQYASNAITTAGQALQNVVDAKADELVDSVERLSYDLETATRNELKKIVGQGFEILENQLFYALDSISLYDYEGKSESAKETLDSIYIPSVGEVTGMVKDQFDAVLVQFEATVRSELSGIPLVEDALIDMIIGEGASVVEGLRSDVIGYIVDNYKADETCNITSLICGQMNIWQKKVVDEIYASFGVADISDYISDKVGMVISEVAAELDEYTAGVTEDLSEEAAAKIKDGVTSYTNNFIDKYMPEQSGSKIGAPDSGGKNSDSLSSIVKLGYKDYLMIFAFIKISTEDGSDKMLTRVADLIQLNIQHASDNSTFRHKKGSDFLMKNAYTYVGIEAKIDLDMLFIDMNLFRRTFDDGTGTYDTSLSKYGIIEYTGLQGY